MTRFKGFGPKALGFFKALKFHQSKAWFDENGRSTERRRRADGGTARRPTAAFAKRGFRSRPTASDRSSASTRRPLRQGKSPYKTHAGAVMTRSGDKKDPGLLDIHIDPEGCFAAAGFHMPEPEQLNAIRRAIKDRPAQFKTVVTASARPASHSAPTIG